MSLYYDSDDAVPWSPGLEPFRPRLTPSPPPLSQSLLVTRQAADPSNSKDVNSFPTYDSEGIQIHTNLPKETREQAWDPLSAHAAKIVSSGLVDKPHAHSKENMLNVDDHTIPSRRSSPDQRLPVLEQPQSVQNDSPESSLNQRIKLPRFRHLSDLAQTVIEEQKTYGNYLSSNSSRGLSPGATIAPAEWRSHASLGPLPSPEVHPIVLDSSHGFGGFKCDHPGCTALPFQTQYLLNSHMNVHSQGRPHFCPVDGCPRAEGGKGFKRKNEMIRHGIVHTSPGYICPFCPDREHKYPRPDNLQRHVRVHHIDKDKDDPLLREVLAQRPESGFRGRRRRVDSEPHSGTIDQKPVQGLNLPEPMNNEIKDPKIGTGKPDQTTLGVPYFDTALPPAHELDERFTQKLSGVSLNPDHLDSQGPVSSSLNMEASASNAMPLEQVYEQVHDQLQSTALQHPIAQQTDQLAPENPFSDSGYGTGSHCSRRPTQIEALEGVTRTESVSLHSSDLNDDGTNDNATVYSDAMSLSDSRVDGYISGLAEDLHRRLDFTAVNDQMIERLTTALPGLLKALALKLGLEAPSQMHRDVMFFIHKHRSAITECFKNHFQSHEPFPDDEERPKSDAPSKEVLSRWLESNDDIEFEPFSADGVREPDDTFDHDFLEEEEEEGEEELLNISGLKEYREFICSDPGYEWLLDCLRRDILLAKPELDLMGHIRQEIIRSSHSTRRISRKRSTQGCKVVFSLEWDLFAFLEEQEFEEPLAEAFPRAITLTGTCKDAQALSCRDYLNQTWPSTGSRTIQLIQEVLKNRGHPVATAGKTANGTTLSASINQSFLVVEASGVPDFVAEIGQQLAWLGAALRTVPSSTRLVYCTPFIDSITPDTSQNLEDSTKELHCSIKFRTEECKDKDGDPSGQCWHALFRMPVIVRGFPIPIRSESGTGLEIPLNMMAALTSTRFVDTFNSKVFIKGFSSMLVPTRKSDDVVVWHLLYNKRPCDRISYLDCGVEHADVKISDLERSRHVVGWCSETVSTVGALAANYSIRRSNLPYTHSAYALEQAQISGGQFVSGTAIFSLSKKDKPVHISRHGYMNKMQWISSKYVNLWDEGEKRGWLVNGVSALLHLLRASLQQSRRKFKSAFLLNPDNLPDADDYTNPDSVIGVLLDQTNRDLKLYVDKTEVFDEETRDQGGLQSRTETKRVTRYYRLEDQVEHIYKIMEKLIDHQTDVERKSGLQINLRPRRQLEGWDFQDLVRDGDPFFPRVSTIPSIGKGWVDFTRSIHTVTLFGQGFGDLLRPKHTEPDFCSRWSLLPSGKYYLAACIADLKEIMENDGDSTSNPMQLCGNMLWHTKNAMFQPCPCTTDATAKHHDPVQALFPLKFKKKLRIKPLVELKDRGAVIFGHSTKLHWHWGDEGDPVRGVIPQEAEDNSSPVNDSGIGSSISPSTSRNGSSSSGSNSPVNNVSQMEGSGSTGPDNGKMKSSKRPLREIMSSISKKMRTSVPLDP